METVTKEQGLQKNRAEAKISHDLRSDPILNVFDPLYQACPTRGPWTVYNPGWF